MAGWSDRWRAGDAGPPVLCRHHACGEISGVELRWAHCGEPCTQETSPCWPARAQPP